MIARGVRTETTAATRPAALGFLGQANDYYVAATQAGLSEVKPVLLYYCFLNLAKTFVLTRKRRVHLDQARHGLSERLRTGGRELLDAYLEARPTSASNQNMYDEFRRSIEGPSGLKSKIDLPLMRIIPQVVPGHRLWADAAGSRERFIAIESLDFRENSRRKEIWLRMKIPSGDLTRIDVTHRELLQRSGLSADRWSEVRDPDAEDGMLVFEQGRKLRYTGRAADLVMNVVRSIAPRLWTTVLDVPPYRKYYLYLCPPPEQAALMPQLSSIYAVTYYLGSITRYRPHHFESIRDGQFGPFFEAFLNDQASQFLYLIASRFAEREVARAALA